MNNKRLKNKLVELLGDIDDLNVGGSTIESWYNGVPHISISFVPMGIITFSKLQAVSDYFETEKINLLPWEESTPDYSSYTPGDPASPNKISIFVTTDVMKRLGYE